jgi:putative phosphoribosyl transferase
MRFQDRAEAGRLLAGKLTAYSGHPATLVLALPRGGVPVAYEVANLLKLPLDIFLVRKLGLPGERELAMGAIASGGSRILNVGLIRDEAIADDVVEKVTAEERQELARREQLYRNHRPALAVQGQTVILVDDGLATGTSMRVAALALKRQQLARLVIAVPVAPPSIFEEFSELADEIVCGLTPRNLHAIGMWYKDFSQTSDQEVCNLLAQASRRDLPVMPSSPNQIQP